MSRPQQDELSRLTGRVTELETLYLHLQRTVQQLDEVVVEQQKRVDTLQARVERLIGQWAAERATRERSEPSAHEDPAPEP
jgi:uncharacterized coiled-coil protein SlyX